MNQQSFALQIWRRYRLVLGLLLVVAGCYLAANYGFIQVNVSGSSGDQGYNYSLAAADGRNSSSQTGPSFRKLVRRGAYELTVSKELKASFNIVNVPGFFQSTGLKVNPTPQRQATFVGDNPSPCVFFTLQLYSYECGGAASDINLHVPATDNDPTYVLPIDTPGLSGDLEGLVQTSSGNIALTHVTGIDKPSEHVASLLGADLNPLKSVPLASLNGNNSYFIKPFMDGFLIYDESFSNTYYYSSLEAKAQKLKIPEDQKGLKPYHLTSYADYLTIAYSSAHAETNLDDPGTKVDSKLLLLNYPKKNSQEYRLKGPYFNDATYCGQSNLCLLSNMGLSVYNISTNKPNYLYAIRGVKSMETVSGQLLLAGQHDILRFDASKKSGQVELDLKNYDFCGMSRQNSSYVVCAINSRSKKVAILVRSNPASDSLVSQISQLLQMKEIQDISASGNILYISADYGPLVYDRQSNSYGVNTRTKITVDAKINQRVKQIGIDRKYHIFLTQ